jgi:hypothetical protein
MLCHNDAHMEITLTRAFVVLVCSSLVTPAFAQATNSVAVDQRVRVTTDTATHIGRVVAVAPESVRVAADDRDPVAIATPAVRKIEISRGRGSKWRTYAIQGAIISGAIGGVLLPLQRETVGENGTSVGKAVALGVWSGGLFGGLIGGAIGASKSADRWEQVWP